MRRHAAILALALALVGAPLAARAEGMDEHFDRILPFTFEHLAGDHGSSPPLIARTGGWLRTSDPSLPEPSAFLLFSVGILVTRSALRRRSG